MTEHASAFILWSLPRGHCLAVGFELLSSLVSPALSWHVCSCIVKYSKPVQLTLVSIAVLVSKFLHRQSVCQVSCQARRCCVGSLAGTSSQCRGVLEERVGVFLFGRALAWLERADSHPVWPISLIFSANSGFFFCRDASLPGRLQCFSFCLALMVHSCQEIDCDCWLTGRLIKMPFNPFKCWSDWPGGGR